MNLARMLTTVEHAQPWSRVDGRPGVMRCALHGEFELPDQCPGCEAMPPPELEDEIGAAIPAPQGCRTLEEHERWYTAIAEASLEDAAKAAKPSERTWHTEGIIAKHREVALKANRAAAELTVLRERRAIVDARERRIRDRARGAGH